MHYFTQACTVCLCHLPGRETPTSEHASAQREEGAPRTVCLGQSVKASWRTMHLNRGAGRSQLCGLGRCSCAYWGTERVQVKRGSRARAQSLPSPCPCTLHLCSCGFLGGLCAPEGRPGPACSLAYLGRHRWLME